MSSRDFRTRPIIITDVETTGLDPIHHEIIEIGAIAVNHNLEELARFDVKVKPDHVDTADPVALEINGYNEKDWENALSQYDAAAQFRLFSAAGILAAWNITFEYTFLKQMFHNAHLIDYLDYHRIDIPSIAWMLIPGQAKFSMDAVAENLHLPPEPKPHRGITGAEYELAILRRLKGMRT
jgi:DNA polymerase-3 subunit epsilon